MKFMQQAVVSGTGHCVPDHVVTNHDLAKIMDTSDEWIQQRSGILERRHVSEGETPSQLAVKAGLKALQRAGRRAEDVDLLLVATLSPEHYFPGTSSFVQRELGLGHVPAMDIRAQCSGFLYGLSVANSMISSGQYRCILLVGTEVHSRGLEFTDRGRDVAVLFGDGAGAVVLEPCEHPERGILNIVLHAEGQHAEKLWVEYPSMARTPHISSDLVDEGRVFPKMDGKFVFKHAVQRLPEVIAEVLRPFRLQARDIDYFLFHQANLRINEYVADLLDIPTRKAPSNIGRYGNCSAASIPILLDECVRDGLIRPGNLVCTAGFGSGFTWGAALLRW